MSAWRFEDLEIWQLAASLAVEFHLLAEKINDRRFFRYAEQLRSAALSMTNNIAEGSGSRHSAEFRQFLNIARRSVYENASMLMIFRRMSILQPGDISGPLQRLGVLSRKLNSFMSAMD